MFERIVFDLLRFLEEFLLYGGNRGRHFLAVTMTLLEFLA